jgi:Ca2+-binding EF-hand superfamily protein
LAAALVFAPGLASATPTSYAQGPRELMQRFDGDGSGAVDESEYVAYLSVGFRVRDVDANGVLEGDELPPGAKPIPRADNEARLRRQFARQDANGNGTLDARELLAPPRG